MRRLSYILMALVLTVALGVSHETSTTEAAVGDQIHQIGNPALGQPPLPFPGADAFCSIGLAFDGTSLYYDRCGDTNIYRINPITAALVDVGGDGGIFNPGIGLNPNALAFDKKRNGLWIGAQSCDATGMPIHFWDFATNIVTPMFTIPFGLINPATGNSFLGFCFIDGLAYNENDPTTDADDEIWFSDDVNPNLGRFSATACPGPSPCGDLVTGFDATTVDPSLATLSGLAVGGSNLYMANNGGGDVFRASIPGLVLLDQFVSADERQEDMECDPVTFAPTEVMWVRTTPQGGAFSDVITAFEIEPNTCGPTKLQSVGTAQFTLRQERPGVADDQFVETATFTLPSGAAINPIAEAVTIALSEPVCGGIFLSLALPPGSFVARAGGKISLFNGVVTDGVTGAPVTAAVRITREGGQDFKVSLDFKTADYTCLEGTDHRKVTTTLVVGNDTMVGEQCFERLPDGDLFFPPGPSVVCP